MNKKKDYEQPKLELVRTDESNKVFFASSGGPAPTGSFVSMQNKTASW